MSEQVYFLTIGLPLATILLVFGMKYFSALQQAKAKQAQDVLYQRLAAQATQAQAEAATLLSSINASMNSLNTRLAAVEAILKEVE